MLAKALQGAGKSAVPAYVEDVFSTYLYTGNGSTQTITNGIDLAGKGGLVWLKNRTGGSGPHNWYTTAIGSASYLDSSQTSGSVTYQEALSTYNSNGFSLSSGAAGGNENTFTYASWTFRKQPKFFDVVTYTGNGATGRSIAHSLGSVPGCIIVKETSAAGDNWLVWHRSLASNDYMYLNTTAATMNANTNFGTHTSTNFVVGGTFNETNQNGSTYVAYLFAHNAGGFGASGTDNVISCGSFTTSASGAATVTLGYEPQFVLFKASGAVDNWIVLDNMRNWSNNGSTGSAAYLYPNLSQAEGTAAFGYPTATGFQVSNQANSVGYIYIAIRRGPMKTPTSGTSVFSSNTYNTATAGTAVTTNFPIDTQISAIRTGSATIATMYDRLRGVSTTTADGSGNYIRTSVTTAETAGATHTRGWGSIGFQVASFWTSNSVISWNLKRAPGFFDVVCYTGTGTNRTVSHNLGVAPELMIIKSRSAVNDWRIYSANIGSGSSGTLDTGSFSANGALYWNSTAPTSTVFTLGSGGNTNTNAATYVAYLFATLAGVSKVGSYTGNGSSQTIACGFTAGARFVMIKRTDSTGDWYVWDTARGIVSGNDPHLSLNTTVAEVTTDDTIDPDNSGFIVNQVAATNVNVTGATYIYFSVA